MFITHLIPDLFHPYINTKGSFGEEPFNFFTNPGTVISNKKGRNESCLGYLEVAII